MNLLTEHLQTILNKCHPTGQAFEIKIITQSINRIEKLEETIKELNLIASLVPYGKALTILNGHSEKLE